jgi:hypothetical protein
MSIVLKRPMFRKGGSVADGVGITSGLTHRKRFADGSDNPMGDYVNTDDNDLYTNAQNADFRSTDVSDESKNARDILKNIVLTNIANEQTGGSTFDQDNKPIQSKSAAEDNWMDYLPTYGTKKESPEATTQRILDYLLTSPEKEEKTTTGEEEKTTIGKEKKTTVGGTTISTPTTVGTTIQKGKNPNAIYNLQGQDITKDLTNIAGLIKSQMTPTTNQNISNLARIFGSTAKSPLELQTIGSALGETAEKAREEDQKLQQEINRYIGQGIIRGVSTLGRPVSGAGSAAANTAQFYINKFADDIRAKAKEKNLNIPEEKIQEMANAKWVEWKQGKVGVNAQQKSDIDKQKAQYIKDDVFGNSDQADIAARFKILGKENNYADYKSNPNVIVTDANFDAKTPFLLEKRNVLQQDPNTKNLIITNPNLINKFDKLYSNGKVYFDLDTRHLYVWDSKNKVFKYL